MWEEILVPIFVVGGLWLMIAAIAVTSINANARGRREMHDTLRKAIESGQTLDPETIAMLHKPTKTWEQDLRSGVILTALALGLGIAGILNATIGFDGGEGGESMGFFIAAIIVGAIGVGQLTAAWLRRERKT